MAKFTRAEIRAIIGEACTDEIENKLVALHLGVVDPLKDDLQKYKAEAEKLPNLQKQLEDATKDGDYKEKYEQLQNQIEGKKVQRAKEKAVRAYFESKNIVGANLDLAMRGCGEEMAAIEVADGKIKDTASLDALIGSTYKGLISATTVKGADPAAPPAKFGNVGMGKYGDIYKKDDKGHYVMSAAERQKAIAEKMANETE